MTAAKNDIQQFADYAAERLMKAYYEYQAAEAIAKHAFSRVARSRLKALGLRMGDRVTIGFSDGDADAVITDYEGWVEWLGTNCEARLRVRLFTKKGKPMKSTRLVNSWVFDHIRKVEVGQGATG